MTPGELFYARKLVRNILSRGHRISVSDGEDWPVRGTRSEDAVMNALDACDVEYLFVVDADVDRPLGSFMLVYGNDPEGDELVADHSDTGLLSAIWNEVFGGGQ